MPPLVLLQQKAFIRDIRFSLYGAYALLILLLAGSLGLVWFGTTEQVNISTTLTYAGRERSLTQKILAETLQTVYMTPGAGQKQLAADELDWTARHDALWRGDHSLSVLSISTFPAIEGKITAVEPLYLALHIAIDAVLTPTTPMIALHQYAHLISADAVPFYNAMEDYNTYLRNLTSRYQSSILLYSACSALAMVLVLLFSALVISRPATLKLGANIGFIEHVTAELQKAKLDAEAVLEEVRRADHGTRIPCVRVSTDRYAVQNGNHGYFSVEKVKGLFRCSCSIYMHNSYCNHIKCVQDAERAFALPAPAEQH